MSTDAGQPLGEAHRAFALEQHLARGTLESAIGPSGSIILREPWLLRVDGRHATVAHYVRPHDIDSGRLGDLRYGRSEFDLAADSTWTLVDRKEVATGDERGPAFLIAGLAAHANPTGTSSHAAGEIDPIRDERAVRNVLAAYGMAADGGDAGLVGDLYTVDTHVDVEGELYFDGRRSMEDMVRSGGHRALLPWAAHTMGPGLVTIDGDRATATHFSRTYGPPSADGPVGHVDDRRPFRFGVNRWELQREADGRWRIARRISRSHRHHDMPELLEAAMLDQMEKATTRPVGPPGALDLLRACTARDLVTAALFAVTARAAKVDRWPFAPGVVTEVDNVRATGAWVLPSALAEPLESVGCLPTAGHVRCDGDRAVVLNAVLDYVDDGRSEVRVGRISIVRWEVEADGDDRFLITRSSIHHAGSPWAAAMVEDEFGTD